MVIDTKGNILTDLELNEMIINDVAINIGSTELLVRRMDSLIEKLENTDGYKKIYKKYNQYLEEIKTCIPGDKKELLMKLDDCYTDILILHEEYFYKQGYIDSFNKNRGVLKSIILWVKQKSKGGKQ